MTLAEVVGHSLEQVTLIIEAARREQARNALAQAIAVRQGMAAERAGWEKYTTSLIAEIERGT